MSDAPDPDAADLDAAPDVVVPETPMTGDDAVDRAVRELAGVMSGSLEDQVSAYESAHRTLQDRLADVEG